jgi:hypothetical protein
MELLTSAGFISCTPIRSLSNGFILVYAQDRLVIASIMNALQCKFVEDRDIIDFIEGYL